MPSAAAAVGVSEGDGALADDLLVHRAEDSLPVDDPTPKGPAWSAHPLGRPGLEIFVASFVVLFQELSLIRWLPGQVRVLAYFPNLILLSAFLGLGLGCLRAGGRSLLWLWPASLLLTAAVAALASNVAFTQESASDHLWLLYYDLPEGAPVVGDVRAPIIAFFLLGTLTFVPLGQYVARRLQLFRQHGIALWGYCLDIAGSLLGVAAFAAAGFAGTTPLVWFAVFAAAGAVLVGGARRRLLVYAAAATALVAIVGLVERADQYSPYYAISARHSDGSDAIEILTNGSYHQRGLRLGRSDAMEDESHEGVRDGYHQPYDLLGRSPGKVLVLGAGTGNDVAVALDRGAERVDAVEIDPVILELGRLHPNRPYDSPRVRAINTDARAFLNETSETYDLIVFGTLDSMTKLSALSSVRLDNFVYTRECIAAAKARLSPGGGLVMYFMVGANYIDQRLAGLLANEFELGPVIHKDYRVLFNRIYMTGPAFSHLHADERRAQMPAVRRLLERIELPSDDWPYLYLRYRQVDAFYLVLIAIFSAIAIASVALASGEMRRSLRRGGIDAEMFLFGFAFLLLETKSVTTMSLLWGATWLTSAVVFGAILAMVLAATVLIQLRPLPWGICIGGLLVSLLVAWAIPVHTLLRLDEWVKLLLSVASIGTPIFFASACFALIFRDREHADTAFGWNLLGAVAGGLIEFASMMTGIRALYLVAVAAYLGVVLLRKRAHAAQSTAPSETVPALASRTS